MSLISVWCERQTASFTKAFKKRYVAFDRESRRLSYAADDQKSPKDVIIVTKVVRCCQMMEVNSSELLTLMVDGKHEDGKDDQWTLRMPSRQVFEEWNKILWMSCAAAGLMDPFNFGLPPIDPRTNLPFAQVPLEYLFKFAALEKAVIYFFGTVTLVTGTTGKDSQPVQHILVVGDKAIYIFNQGALTVFCSHLNYIRKIHHGPEATFIAVQMKPPAPDLVVKDFSDGVQLTSILTRLCQVMTGKRLNVMPINVPTAEVLVESQQLRLCADGGYKAQFVPPNNKMRLQQIIRDNMNEMDANVDRKGLGQQHAGNDASNAAFTHDPNCSEPLEKLLHTIGLSEYTQTLLSQHVDLDVLQCMDASDLMTFGVTDESHCRRILEAALNSDTTTSNHHNNVSGVFNSNVTRPTGDIELSDNDDSDLALPLPGKKPVMLDDDSDDDLLVQKPQTKGSSKPRIIIDDDDDL